MAKELTSVVSNQISKKSVKAEFTFTVNGTDFSTALVTWTISNDRKFGAASASFVLTNADGAFGEGGANQLEVGDIVQLTETFAGDTVNWNRFYGIINQRSISKSAGERTITIVCLDYISTLQFLDIDLEVEGTKVQITDETLTPNFLDAPNATLAQLFDFNNDAIAQDPPPIIMIRDQNHLTDDPQYDGFCYAEDTEIMTENGWMLLADIVKNNTNIKIATLNSQTNFVEYHTPLNYFEFPYKGKMFHQKSRSLDLLVTPNHKLWIGNSQGKNFEFIEAKSSNRYCTYKKDFPCGDKKDVEFFILPEYVSKRETKGFVDILGRICPNYESSKIFKSRNIKMDGWLEFLGIWLAEGWLTKNYNLKSGIAKETFIHLCQNEGESLERIKKIVNKITDKFECKPNYRNPKNYEIRFCDIQLAQYLKQFGKSHDKFIPRDLLNILSKRQLQILLDALILGDGNKKNGNYITSSLKLANDVNEIMLKLGKHSLVTKFESISCFGKTYVIYNVSQTSQPKTHKVNYGKDNRRYLDYDGEVYCLEVPNHIIYVRRNGKPVWCGNSILYDVGQLKLGSPLQALDNYDVVARSYWFYTVGVYAEDVLEEILTQADGYDKYLFGETSTQAIIDNHLKDTFYNVEGTGVEDYLTPNYTTSTIEIRHTVATAIAAGATTIVLDSTAGLPSTGTGSISGDTFTWTSISGGTTLLGVSGIKTHPVASVFKYETDYDAGQVWYLKYSNLVTVLVSGNFDLPSGSTINYVDARFGRIILNTAISLASIVKCTVNYTFKTLQATGIELNKISFRSRELENRYEAINKLRNYIAPNYIIRTIGDNKIWASYLSQKTNADYTLNLVQNLDYLEDEDLYTRVKMWGKNDNPSNLLFGDTIDFVTTGETYTGFATQNELVALGEEGNYWIYGNSLTDAGYINLDSIVPIVYINGVAIDNKSHQLAAMPVVIDVSISTETRQGCHGISKEQYIKTHAYYYYKVRFGHTSIEPNQPIYLYSATGLLVTTITPGDGNMDYGRGVWNVPGEEKNTDIESISTASYSIFYSSGSLIIDYDNVSFKISKSILPSTLGAEVTGTFEYWTVMTPIEDIASIIDGRWDTQVQTEFFSEPPSGYNYAIIDIGSVQPIQALDIVAGFYKPDNIRKFDIDMRLTLHYSTNGTDYFNISDATKSFGLTGGERKSFDEENLGVGFEARYLKIVLENVKKIAYGNGVWVVAFTEIAAYNNIILSSNATLIPTTTLTQTVVPTDTTLYVVSTAGFTDPASAETSTAYINDIAFTYSGLTTTTFTGVDLSSGFTAAIGDYVNQTLVTDTTVYDTESLLPKLGDRVYKDVRISDQILYNQAQLDLMSKVFLQEFVKNHTKLQANVMYAPYLMIGHTTALVDAFNNTNQNYFVDSIQETNGFYNLTLARYP